MQLPQEHLQKIQCHTCKKLLSVGPVHVLSDGSSICGRCPKSYGSYRHHAYEALASGLYFPCSFENCKEQLPWGKVEDHENTCQYRPYNCPLWDCDFVGTVKELWDHLKDKHAELYLEEDDDLELDFSQDQDIMIFSGSSGRCFIIKGHFKLEKLYLNLFYIPSPGISENITAEVYLKDEEDMLSLKKIATDIIRFDNEFPLVVDTKSTVVFEKIPSLFPDLKARLCLKLVTNKRSSLMVKNNTDVNFSRKCVCPCEETLELNSNIEDAVTGNFDLACIHAGCSLRFKVQDFDHHLSNCEHRFFKCNCNFKANYKDLEDHYRSLHEHCVAKRNRRNYIMYANETNGDAVHIIYNTIFHISVNVLHFHQVVDAYVVLFRVSKASLNLRRFKYEFRCFNFVTQSWNACLAFTESESKESFSVGLLVDKRTYENYYKCKELSLEFNVRIQPVHEAESKSVSSKSSTLSVNIPNGHVDIPNGHIL